MRFGHWIASTVVAISLSDSAHAHLGNRPISEAERVSRELAAVNSRRLLENCINSDAGRQLQEKAIARRLAMLHSYTNHRRLDVSTALATNHMSNLTGLSSTTDPSTLFSSTPACLLEPEVTEGPYYVAGELVRSDIRESQPGIDLYMDLQFIDITSCKPVNNLYVDFWHANSSGVYSGVVASTNGNSKDASNVNSTFHRGLSPTDSNGFVSFATKFPGFYTGRTTHVHIMTHYNGTLNNRRYTGGHVSHVGQLFFDQSLLTTVQGTGVYANNKNQATKNADDNIVKQAAANAFDPFVKYALLGNTVGDGLLSWISVGVDMTQSYHPNAISTYTGSGVSDTTTTTSTNTTTNSTTTGSTSTANTTTISTNTTTTGNDGQKLGYSCAQVLAAALILINFLVL